MNALARRTAALTLLTGLVSLGTLAPASAAPYTPPVATPTCSANSQPRLTLGTADWLVSVDTSGGFTGRGAGNYAARSDGTIWSDGCVAHINSATLANLSAVVATTHDADWKKTYRSPGDDCCDQIYTTLTIVRANGRHPTTNGAAFSSASERGTPADYHTLYDAVGTVTRPYDSRVPR